MFVVLIVFQIKVFKQASELFNLIKNNTKIFNKNKNKNKKIKNKKLKKVNNI